MIRKSRKVVGTRRSCRQGRLWASMPTWRCSTPRVIDKSTHTKRFQYSEGVEYVIVNGQIGLDKGKHTEGRLGKALRRNP